MTLDELVAQLRSAYGDVLKAVVLYGSAVAGEHHKQQSDYNILVVVDRLPLDRLEAASAAMRAWRDAGNPPPLTFTTHEWRGSSDVFPMEYADILDRHQTLYGEESILEGIGVDLSDLRLQVEREALNKVFRLRQGVLLAGTDTGRQLALMSASLSAIMVVFRGVARLHNIVPPRNYADLVRAVAQPVGLDAGPFVEVVLHAREEQKIAKERANLVLAGYLRGVEQVATYVNGFTLSRTES